MTVGSLRRVPERVASAATRRRTAPQTRGLRPRDAWVVLATLALLVLLNIPLLGAEPWPFDPGRIDPRGTLGWVVDGVGAEWDPEALRAAAVVAGLLVALAAGAALVTWRPGPRALAVIAVAVVALLLLPAVLLQAALRESTAPWFFTNDSTYQIELSGELLRDGENPYGHDYRGSGLERFYSMDGSVVEDADRRPALRHFLYFPGPALSASVSTLLPRPWDDYRFVVALATLGGFLAALAFRGPLPLRLAAGAIVAANPFAVRAAWFGNADATSFVFLLLALALVTRRRYLAAGAALGAAVAFKQFALLAVPFFLVMVLTRAGRREAVRAGGAFGAVVALTFLPFVAWDPGAFLADTFPTGEEAYRIVGPGLASLLVEAGVIESRTSAYPFVPIALVTWLPVTAWLVWSQLRTRTLWSGAVGFAVSMLVFVFISRVFQPSFLVWPLVAIVAAGLLAAAERDEVLRDRPAG